MSFGTQSLLPLQQQLAAAPARIPQAFEQARQQQVGQQQQQVAQQQKQEQAEQDRRAELTQTKLKFIQPLLLQAEKDKDQKLADSITNIFNSDEDLADLFGGNIGLDVSAGETKFRANSLLDLKRLRELSQASLDAEFAKTGDESLSATVIGPTGEEELVVPSILQQRQKIVSAEKARLPFQLEEEGRQETVTLEREQRKRVADPKFLRVVSAGKNLDRAIATLETNPNVFRDPRALLGRSKSADANLFNSRVVDALSIEILQRSGLAVSEKEFGRLKKSFVPSLFVTPETAKARLNLLKQIFDNDIRVRSSLNPALEIQSILGEQDVQSQIDDLLEEPDAARTFNTLKDAEKAKLPSGTNIIIGGRRARVN